MKQDDVMAALDQAPVKAWFCPLHSPPGILMTTVVWDGNEATCTLCGFTRSEGIRRAHAALDAEDAVRDERLKALAEQTKAQREEI